MRDNSDLFGFQREGVQFLASNWRAWLCDEMGLGKSAQIIRALREEKAYRTLVICPAVVRGHWRAQFAKWWPSFDRVSVLTNLGERVPRAGVVIVSYEYAAECTSKLMDLNWKTIVLDESHYVRNPDAKRSNKIFGRHGLAHWSDNLWLITGTPMPHGAKDLWLPLYVFGVTKLTYEQWLQRYCNGYYYAGRHVVGSTKKKYLKELEDMLHESGVFLRRRKADVAQQLPPVTFEDVDITLRDGVPLSECNTFKRFIDGDFGGSTCHLNIILQAQREYYGEILSAPSLDERVRMLISSSDSLSTLLAYLGIRKVPDIVDLVDYELDACSYEKIVIFAVHRDVIKHLTKGLAKWGAVCLHGGTVNPDTVLKTFRNDPQCCVLVAQSKAGGIGIDLTCANQVLMAESDLDPTVNAQAIARPHRWGQELPVTVRWVLSDDPLDNAMIRLVQAKVFVAASVLRDSVKNAIRACPQGSVRKKQ